MFQLVVRILKVIINHWRIHRTYLSTELPHTCHYIFRFWHLHRYSPSVHQWSWVILIVFPLTHMWKHRRIHIHVIQNYLIQVSILHCIKFLCVIWHKHVRNIHTSRLQFSITQRYQGPHQSFWIFHFQNTIPKTQHSLVVLLLRAIKSTKHHHQIINQTL